MRRALVVLSLTAAVLGLTAMPARAGGADDVAAPDAAVLKVGEREYFTKCFSCHSLEEGGGHKGGPNLWNIFGAKAGGKADFTYSAALRKSGITWSPKSMDKWLAGPAAFLPGNLMAFAGLPNEQDRKALVVYLQKMTGAE